MGYTALYRKYRPQLFSDVCGQEHIITTLKNQLKAGRVGHAYLFTGTRGTGKTTVAKILARAVNCEDLKDGEPCGECESCRRIAEGRSFNVAEVDAASNNNVDKIRSIIDEIEYPPTDGRYKVYILDEAHMLTGAAANALLKTLEEPPEYVIFILATTDVQRLPITILSRTQRYDFRRIDVPTIASRMKQLLEEEGLKAEDPAINYVARAADGSMRDGLSLLDRCVSLEEDGVLTLQKVLDILGNVGTEIFDEFISLLINEDVIGCIRLIDEIMMQGRDPVQFVVDFVAYMRNIMLLKASEQGDMEDLLNVSPERLEEMKETASFLDDNTVFRYIDIFSELAGRIRYSTQKRTLIEMCVIRLMRPQMDTDLTSVLERVRRLEKTIEKLESGEMTVKTQAVVAAAPEKAKEPERLPEAVPEDIEKIAREWEIIKGKASGLYRGILGTSVPRLGDNGQLLIMISGDLKKASVTDSDIKASIAELLREHSGKEVSFDLIEDGKTGRENSYDLSKYIHMNITEED